MRWIYDERFTSGTSWDYIVRRRNPFRWVHSISVSWFAENATLLRTRIHFSWTERNISRLG